VGEIVSVDEDAGESAGVSIGDSVSVDTGEVADESAGFDEVAGEYLGAFVGRSIGESAAVDVDASEVSIAKTAQRLLLERSRWPTPPHPESAPSHPKGALTSRAEERPLPKQGFLSLFLRDRGYAV
jgi:hypothetical protein